MSDVYESQYYFDLRDFIKSHDYSGLMVQLLDADRAEHAKEVSDLKLTAAGIVSKLKRDKSAHQKRNEHLDREIDALASVLLQEFGGPTQNESACEMAVRLLREFRKRISELGTYGEELRKAFDERTAQSESRLGLIQDLERRISDLELSRYIPEEYTEQQKTIGGLLQRISELEVQLETIKNATCLTCGRSLAPDGDCYGCEVDRLAEIMKKGE